MNSRTIEDFWEFYRSIPKRIREQAQEAYRQFQADPLYPGLNFEEVNKRRNLWSARVTGGYRVLGYREGDTITWIWKWYARGYDKLIKGH